MTYHYATLYRSDGNNENVKGTSPNYYIDGIKGESYFTFNLNNPNSEGTPVEVHFRGATNNDGISVTITISDRDGTNATDQIVAITKSGGWDPISGGNEYNAYFASVGTGDKLLKITYNGSSSSWIASLGAFSIKKVASKSNKTLAIQSNNEEWGTVSSVPGAGSIAAGTAVTLTATRQWGCDFVNWTNVSTSDVLGTEKTYNFTLDNDITIQGNFSKRSTTQYIPAVTTLDPEVVTKTGGTFKEVTFKGNTVTSFDNFGTENTATFALNNTVAQYYKIVVNTANNSSQQPTSNLTVTLRDKDSNIIGTKTFETAGTDWADWIERSFTTSLALPVGAAELELAFTNVNVVGVSMIAPEAETLNESSDYTPTAKFANVTLTRTLPDDKWATIMLPFDRTAAQLRSDLGVTTVTLAAFTSFSGNALNFTSADAITANTPYMIKVSEAVSEPKTISGVNIVTTGDQYVDQNGVRFQGVYSSTEMKAGDYFFSNNKLYKATSTKSIKPFRAYFKDVPAGARLMFFDETTGISEVMGNTEKASGNYYDLQGRRIAQPQKGLYIVNGKKVFVK